MINQPPLCIESEPVEENKIDPKKYSVPYPKDKKGDIIYNILFECFPEENNLTIKVNEIADDNTKNKIKPIYSANVSIEEWNKLAPDPSLFNNFSSIFNELRKTDFKNYTLKFYDNYVNLDIKLGEYGFDPIKISLKEEKNEIKDLNPNKIIEENLNLNKENKILEERVNFLEREIELLKSALPNYLDKSLFQKLKSSKIIKEVEQLELINRGINNLFQKNIKDIILKYEFKEKDKNNSLLYFNNIYKNLTNVLLVVKTKEFRSFGAFYQKKENSFKNNFNQNDLYQTERHHSDAPNYGYEDTTVNLGQGNINYIPIQYDINLNPMQYSNSFFFFR